MPAGSSAAVSELSARELERGRRIADAAIADLIGRHPELADAARHGPTPVYDEHVAAPVGVSVRLDLPTAVDVTMDLVHTVVDDQGRRVIRAQLSAITNLRGLVMDVSLESAEVEALYPAPDPATHVRVSD